MNDSEAKNVQNQKEEQPFKEISEMFRIKVINDIERYILIVDDNLQCFILNQQGLSNSADNDSVTLVLEPIDIIREEADVFYIREPWGIPSIIYPITFFNDEEAKKFRNIKVSHHPVVKKPWTNYVEPNSSANSSHLLQNTAEEEQKSLEKLNATYKNRLRQSKKCKKKQPKDFNQH